MDAHDGSDKMLQIAKSKNIYRNVFQELLEPNQASKNIPQGYDILVSAGCFCPGHLNSDHLQGILDLVKVIWKSKLQTNLTCA